MKLSLTRAAAVAAALLASVAAAGPAAAAEAPSERVLYADGPDGRHLLGGRWLFRLDGSEEWAPVRVPYAWNAGDDSVASMQGGVGWYRKDFKLPDPSRALSWVVRFESVNYRTRVWLNGRRLGSHRGAYLPFEFALDRVKRTGTNRLVVRVDSRRGLEDFPPSGLSSTGVPTGGWFNYGGILREVYLRRVEAVDFEDVVVRPELPCSKCAARVLMRVRLRNVGSRPRRVRVSGRYGSRRVSLGTATVPAGGVQELARRVTIRRPRLWSPASPRLYRARLEVTDAGGAGVLAGYSLRSGIRSIRVRSDGRLLLNGEVVQVRGVGFHEDTRERGFAITNDDREWLVREAQALGATMMRTHYPPHPYLHELADRAGMLLWSEIPVYGLKSGVVAERSVRARAVREAVRNARVHQNHPSVAIWSIANELSSKAGLTQGYYIRRATGAVREVDPTRPIGLAVREVDPTRPIGLAVAGYPSAGCQEAYAPLDVIGINEYFGWYPGPGGQLMDRERLSEYLDGVRACYPGKAVMITEFGAEANRDGPVEEKGTWAFQRDFVNYHLSVYASKPWLAGTLYWALNEFRVRPGWDGGNPRPQPPIHQKGLVSYDRVRKPAWTDVQQWFTGRYVLPGR